MYLRFRWLLRTIERVLRVTYRRILNLPSDLYAWIYVMFRLNRVYHGLQFSGETQIWLLPRRLPVSRRLMSQPYRIPLSSIKWGGRPRGGKLRVGDGKGCGFIFDGDWDIEDKRNIEQYLLEYIYSRTVYQLCRDNLPYDQTDQFSEISRFVEHGLVNEWQARGCRSKADIKYYFKKLQKTFKDIRIYGYKTQEELGSSRWFDEIKVFVDRNGELQKQQGAGHHRLAMVRILEITEIPVLVIGVHRAWALQAQCEIGEDILTSIDIKIREMSECAHNDLS